MSAAAGGCTSASIVPGSARTVFSDIDCAESLPVIVHAFSSLDIEARAAMLGRLLASVGPLAMAVVANGAFAKYVPYARSVSVPVSTGDAALATPIQVAEVVQYVRQSDPKCFATVLVCDLAGAIDLRGRDAEPRELLPLPPHCPQ